MKKLQLPQTDSIRKLAEFWNTHDLADFDDDLDDVAEPIFVRDSRPANAIRVPLEQREADAI